MGIARHFNAGSSSFSSPNEYLASAVSADSYGTFTCCAWIKRDYSGTRNGIMGRMFGAVNGWMFFADELSRINFYVFTTAGGGTGFTTTSPVLDLSSWIFVAATYDGANVNLWSGDTPENLHIIATAAVTGTFSELGVRAIFFGNIVAGDEFASPIFGWNGSADQFGIWFIALSIDELRLAMGCNTRVRPDQTKYIVDVDGVNPETGVGQSLAYATFTVNGTEVVEGPNIGCEYVPYDDRFSPESLYLWSPYAIVGEIAAEGGGGDGGGGAAVCAPFRLFWQDSNVRVHGWEDGNQAYRVVRPFGGPHQTEPSGAEI